MYPGSLNILMNNQKGVQNGCLTLRPRSTIACSGASLYECHTLCSAFHAIGGKFNFKQLRLQHFRVQLRVGMLLINHAHLINVQYD
mmetsp:Transcript_12465/g.26539  ORF Transcript_12465/g.26539 Transcript_12465/m.26539 type:complete len:86 (+) Transcript_12465:759-1016(+)